MPFVWLDLSKHQNVITQHKTARRSMAKMYSQKIINYLITCFYSKVLKQSVLRQVTPILERIEKKLDVLRQNIFTHLVSFPKPIFFFCFSTKGHKWVLSTKICYLISIVLFNISLEMYQRKIYFVLRSDWA